MDRINTPPKSPLFLCSSLLVCFFINICSCKPNNYSNGEIKGLFVFGSSLVDNGNNNFLQGSMAKANYSPYGIDFPLGPSGRFTNGRNVIDLIGEELKIPKYIPSFNDPRTKGSRIVHGVNFASGGSGILDETGSIAVVTSLNQQIKNFEEVTLPELETQLLSRSSESLPNYLFVVGAGGNDYTLNYFATRPNVSLEAFTANLTVNLYHQLKRLYGSGARKFVLMSLYPIGCSPGLIRARQPAQKGCIQTLNQAANLFNIHLKSLVVSLKMRLPGSTFVYVNAYKIVMDILKNPAAKGFNDMSNPCCEVPSVGTGIMCARGGSTCANRSNHVYFDGLHPTEAVNIVLASKAFASTLEAEVYPINLQQLVQI